MFGCILLSFGLYQIKFPSFRLEVLIIFEYSILFLKLKRE